MIKINGLNFKYDHSDFLLENLSLEIQKGDIVGLIGCNGAGKSTLLSLLCGIHFPHSGEIIIDDVPLNKKNIRTIRQSVGMVFQNPDEQLFMPTVFEDVAFGPENFHLPHVKSRVLDTLKKLNIEHLKDNPTHKLSGGEKRLVAIATVLSMEPSCLLFDEPTAFLDTKSKRNFISVIKNLNLTMLIAAHDLNLVSSLCNKVIVLKNGSLLSFGETSQILNDSSLLSIADL